MVFAFRALFEERAVYTFFGGALVFFVTFTISSGIFQDSIVRANIAIIVFIINKLVFLKKAFLL